MRQLQCFLDSFSVSFNENQGLIIVSAQRAPDGVWPPHLLPTLCGGRRAHHVSLPLLPRHSGPEAGNYWPHLTYIWKDERGREVKEHKPLTLISVEEGAAFERSLEARILEQAQELIEPVDLHQLADEGWQLRRVTASVRDKMQETVDQRRRVRFGLDELETTLSEEAELLIEPVSMRSLLRQIGEVPPEIHVVRRIGDDLVETRGYLFRPARAPQGQWFILLAGALQHFLHDSFCGMVPVLEGYARTALREMQADVPRSFIDEFFGETAEEKALPSVEELFGWRR